MNVALLLLAYVQARREILQRDRQRRSLVEQRRLLEEQVQERTAQLSELSSNLQNVQEAEKAKLARDIHDELGSILVSARMDVSWVQRRVEPLDPTAAQKLARASSTLDEGVQIKRRIIEDLRPTLLDNLGLAAALSWHVKRGVRARRARLPSDHARGGSRAAQSGGDCAVSRRPGGDHQRPALRQSAQCVGLARAYRRRARPWFCATMVWASRRRH